MLRLRSFIVFGLLVPQVAQAECTDFSERRWGCGSLGCAIVDAIAVGVAAVPRYERTISEGPDRQGLGWEAIVAMAPDERACHEWEHDVAVGYSWYPWLGSEYVGAGRMGRASWRTWSPTSLVTAEPWNLRLGFGAGGHVGLGGAGPRLELRLWLGQQERLFRTIGCFVSGAYEPDLVQWQHRGQFAVGIELPINI